MNNFAVLDITQTLTMTGFQIALPTNNPCHLTCYWTDKKPLRHPTERTIRGLTVPWGVYFCFVSWHEVEQKEAGDTLDHTFNLSPWAHCETRWFTFRGTVANILSPSVGPIFEKHRYVPLPIVSFQNSVRRADQAIGPYVIMAGQRLNDFTSMIFNYWVRLRRSDAATGNAYCRIRRVIDDSIIATSPDILDVTTLPILLPIWYPFTFPALEIENQSVRLLLEYSGPSIYMSYSITDEIPGFSTQYWGGWTDWPPYDYNVALNKEL